MKILALDTSSRAASCAVSQEGTLLGEYFINSGLTHSQTILPMVEHLLSTSKQPLDTIDLIAVSHGPGSFTGLRIGISSVKGMAMALDIPVLGISTLTGLAYNIRHLPGLIVPTMDARRNNLYTAIFRSHGIGSSQPPTPLLEDSNLPIATLGEHITALRQPEEPVFLVGDGALLTLTTLEKSHPYLTLGPAALLHQRASSLCDAALELLKDTPPLQPQALEPQYLRITQAERERRERLQDSENT